MIVAGILSGLVGLLVDFVQAVLDGFAALINAILTAWPIGMPTLPTIPTAMLDVFGFFRWGPLGVVWDAMWALFLFMVTVWICMAVAGPVLRALKVWD